MSGGREQALARATSPTATRLPLSYELTQNVGRSGPELHSSPPRVRFGLSLDGCNRHQTFDIWLGVEGT
jgi:hypothetical protein